MNPAIIPAGIFVIISIIGASVRHYFNLRNQKKYNVWILPTATFGMICLMLYVSIPKINTKIHKENLEIISFNEVNNIIKYRCGVCHAKNPTFEGFEHPPKGIIFDTAKDIINNHELESILVRVRKPNAPLNGVLDTVEVEIERKQKDYD